MSSAAWQVREICTEVAFNLRSPLGGCGTTFESISQSVSASLTRLNCGKTVLIDRPGPQGT